MKRAVWTSALALSCATSGEVREAREMGGGADPCAPDPPGEVRERVMTAPVDTAQARFVEHTEQPRLLNTEDLIRATDYEYTRVLREARIGGTTVVHVLIDEKGCVADTIVNKSSGNAGLDRAALRVASVARFAPARNRERSVAIWIELPITFTPR